MDGTYEHGLDKLNADMRSLLAVMEQMRAQLMSIETYLRGSEQPAITFEGLPDSIGYKHGTIGRSTTHNPMQTDLSGYGRQ
jgi:hypothetical protein